jgi:hypothetical protein
MHFATATTLTCLLLALPLTALAQEAEAAEDTAAEAPAAPAKPVEASAEVSVPVKADAAPAATKDSEAEATEAPAPRGAESGGCRATIGDRNGYRLGVCGYISLNAMHDSTQSFKTGVHNNLIARRGTYIGDHDQMQFTARDSRLTVEVGAPEYAGIKPSGMLQFDFNGFMPAETNEADFYVLGAMRMRHAYLKLETPVVDVLAGQYHDLFGWGGAGFYPATLAFLGVTGQVYHRQPQLRLSKAIEGEALDLEFALAATRPVHKAAGLPDGQAGARMAFNGWKGASTQGYGQPGVVPLGLGVSAVVRRFEVPEFIERPAEPETATGWGVVANAVIPIIPAESNDDRSNALTLTGEFSLGSGISDLYTELTGGALFPLISNDASRPVPPLFNGYIDSGIVTYDGRRELRTVDWRGFVIGAQYYLPVAKGRIWISGIYSRIQSDNIVELTPIPSRGLVYHTAEYIDGSLFFALTEAVQTGVSFQTVEQTFGDEVKARNNRGEFGMFLFF